MALAASIAIKHTSAGQLLFPNFNQIGQINEHGKYENKFMNAVSVSQSISLNVFIFYLSDTNLMHKIPLFT